MAPSSGGQGGGPVIKGILYSLPRLIAKPISAVFSAYLGELYIHTFEWRPEDFGLVTSTYSFFRSMSYMVLGLIFHFIIGENGQEQRNQGSNNHLQTSKIIAVTSIAIYALTFIFLILLPIRWYGINTPILNRLAKITGKFWNLLCRGRITSRRYTTPYERAEGMPKILHKLSCIPPEPKPPPRRIARLDSLRYTYGVSFIKSKLFVIIAFAIIHGIGLSSYELSNRAIPMYIEKNEGNIRTMTSINFGMYSTGYLLTIMIISLIKYYLSRIINDADLFAIVAIFFILLQFVILPVFYHFTSDGSGGSAATTTQCNCNCQPKSETCRCQCNTAQASAATSSIKFEDWCQLFAMIGLHGSINFWLATSGPVAQYTAKYIHGGNNTLKNFGPFILLGFETLTNVGYTVYTVVTAKDDKCCCCCRQESGTCNRASNCTCQCATRSSTECCCKNSSTSSSSSMTDKVLTALSVAAQGFIYLLFYRFDYWWNKNSWFNFALFAICGVVYGLFLMNITNVLTAVVKKKCFEQYKWIIYGGMLLFMYFSNSVTLYALYKVYDTEKLFNMDYAITRHLLDCTFAGVYKSITFIFQVMNIIAACLYFFNDKDTSSQS